MNVEIHSFFCTKCGNIGIPIPRKKGDQRERFHKKKLYCIYCKEEVNHIECRTMMDEVEFRKKFLRGEYKVDKRLTILIGCPGSGKSTYIKTLPSANMLDVVSRDEIRFSLLKDNDEYFSKEKEVYKTFIKTIQDKLDDPLNHKIVVADATHLSMGSRRKLFQNLKLSDVEINLVYFNVPFEMCKELNAKREGRSFVPEDQLEDMYKNLSKPDFDEHPNIKSCLFLKGVRTDKGWGLINESETYRES
jgi:predicted kinase